MTTWSEDDRIFITQQGIDALNSESPSPYQGEGAGGEGFSQHEPDEVDEWISRLPQLQTQY